MQRSADPRPKSEPPVVDRMLRTVIATVTAGGPPPPTRMLTPLRARAVEHTLGSHYERAASVAARLSSGDDHAKQELAALATEALSSMRADVQRRATDRGLLARVVAHGDARWGDCQADELLDDPTLDQAMRTGIMETLDDFNELIESYGRFFDQLLPLANPNGPTRVLDLAAGHGGFALAAAREARSRGLDFQFTASDLKREYLDIGEEIARRDGLEVEFAVQDALDLSNLAPGAYDIIICTQSLHHFPPGLVAVMFEAAARAETRGVVFIDACRSLLSGVTSAVIAARMRNAPWFHDAWISTRKSYVPEELELLARISQPGGDLDATWMPPCHCLLRWRAPEAAVRV